MTNRIRLVDHQDSALLFALIERNRLRLRRWLSWLDYIRVEADTRHFITAAIAGHANRTRMDCVVAHEGAIIGMVGLYGVDHGSRSANLTYWIDEVAGGRGLLSTAVRDLLAIGYGDFGLHRLEIRACSQNAKSCALAERLGFRRVGVIDEAQWLYDHWVDNVIYTLLKRDWQEQG